MVVGGGVRVLRLRIRWFAIIAPSLYCASRVRSCSFSACKALMASKQYRHAGISISVRLPFPKLITLLTKSAYCTHVIQPPYPLPNFSGQSSLSFSRISFQLCNLRFVKYFNIASRFCSCSAFLAFLNLPIFVKLSTVHSSKYTGRNDVFLT